MRHYTRLAPKYNLSGVGFAKLCRRCDIPLPPRGYWAKLEAGQKIKRTPLPTIEEESEIRVHVPDPAEVERKEKARMEAECNAKEEEKRTEQERREQERLEMLARTR